MDLPAGGPRPFLGGQGLKAAKNVSEAFSPPSDRPGSPMEPPRGGGGRGVTGTCQQKTLGFRVSTFIPLPWEVPEGPACMVPVA